MTSKLVIVGGSSLNTPAFFAALPTDALALDEVCLLGRSAERTEVVASYCQWVANKRGLPISVTWDTDVAHAVGGARWILNQMRVGNHDVDDRNLAWSGVVGHAAGYAEAIRHLPPTLALARAIQSHAPGALLINFTNPVSVLCEAVARETSINVVGICQHASAMRRDFAILLNAPVESVEVEYYGLNHLGWVTDARVDGVSRMETLLGVLAARRLKRYNFAQAQRFGIIPIDHAFSLYHKGETFYVRQKGVRGSLRDALAKSGLYRRRAMPDRLKAFARRDAQLLGLLRADAPWYKACIVPFLAALQSDQTRVFTLTWRVEDRVPCLPGVTAECVVTLRGAQIAPIPITVPPPDFAVALLRLVRESERLLIRAVIENSFDLAAQALMIHPNVVSLTHAERFLRHFFPSSV